MRRKKGFRRREKRNKEVGRGRHSARTDAHTHAHAHKHSHRINNEEDDGQGDGQVKVSPIPQHVSNARQQHVTEGEGHRKHDANHASMPHAARLHRCGKEADSKHVSVASREARRRDTQAKGGEGYRRRARNIKIGGTGE